MKKNENYKAKLNHSGLSPMSAGVAKTAWVAVIKLVSVTS